MQVLFFQFRKTFEWNGKNVKYGLSNGLKSCRICKMYNTAAVGSLNG